MLQRPLAIEGSTSAAGNWLQWFVTPDSPQRSGGLASYAALTAPAFVMWGERHAYAAAAGPHHRGTAAERDAKGTA